jgi:hypothetical protein
MIWDSFFLNDRDSLTGFCWSILSKCINFIDDSIFCWDSIGVKCNLKLLLLMVFIEDLMVYNLF